MHLHHFLSLIWLLLFAAKVALVVQTRRHHAAFMPEYAWLEASKTAILLACSWFGLATTYYWTCYTLGFLSHAIALGVAISCFVALVDSKQDRGIIRGSCLVLATLTGILVWATILNATRTGDFDTRAVMLADQAFVVILCGCWGVLLLAANPKTRLVDRYAAGRGRYFICHPDDSGKLLCLNVARGFAVLYFAQLLVGLLPIQAGWGPKMLVEIGVIAWWIRSLKR